MKSCLTLLCFCFSGFLISQNQYLDSLLASLKTAKEDTNKVLLLNYISQDILKTNTQEALKYARTSYELSQKLNYERGRSIGIINMGRCYQSELNYKEALRCYLEGLAINQKRNNKLTIAKSYGDIAGVYADLMDPDKAILYHHKKIKLLKELDGSKIDRSLAITYSSIGVIYKDKLKYDSALKYIALSEDLNLLLNDSTLLAATFFNKGLIYDEMPGFDKEALLYYQKSLDISLLIDNEAFLPNIYIGIADIYNKQGKYKEALSSAEKGITYSRLTGNKIWIKYGYQSMIKAYEGLKDHISQNKYFEKLLAFNDSVSHEENDSKLAEWRIKFETEEKEKDNLILINKMQAKEFELNRTLYLTYSLGIAILFIVCIAWMLIRQNKLQAKQKTIQLEQKLLRSQMNPHFIFNCLQAIQNFTLKNNGKEATRYLSLFGALTRSVLQNSRVEEISLQNEITLLEQYLELQKLLTGNRFEYKIYVSPEVDTLNTNLPPMLAQPFIENAIEHGMRQMQNGGKIDICFSERNDNLVFEISDNGTGIIFENKVNHHSLATAITGERIDLMNKKNNKKASFNIQEAYPDQLNKGVKVSFVIPLN